MFWKSVKTLSLANRLLIIFICSTTLILLVITALIYPPMKELLHKSHLNHENYNYLLTQICIKKFFIGLWISTGIIITASYFLAKKSIKPIKRFSQALTSIGESSLDKRLDYEEIPQELQELALTCNEMLFRIEKAFSCIKQFSASMAHELRTPIHFLQNTTEITLARPQTVETYQNVLHTHLEEYQNLTHLIENLLFLTRSDRRQLQLNIKTLSANQLINTIVEYYQSVAEDKGIEIHVVGEAQIQVDEQLFKRVISNLIDNSLTYSNPEGKINIFIETRQDKSTEIIIKDNGIGILKKHLPLLCQGFYRVNSEEKKENAGLGLGLAIAKSIMEYHKGKLIIDSQLGLGTKVRLTLINSSSA